MVTRDPLIITNARLSELLSTPKLDTPQVSTTREVSLEWPDFACSFNHLVRLRLVRRPESVMISIYSCSGVPWWPDQARRNDNDISEIIPV